MNGNFCPNCGAQVTNGNTKFCPNCGASMGGGYGSDPFYNQTSYNDPFSSSSYGAPENFNLISAYKSMFKKYAQFNGRSRRSEYWLASLANCLIFWAAYLLLIIIGIGSVNYGSYYRMGADYFGELGGFALFMGVLIMIYGFAVIIPSLAMTVRRLHDTGKSAWWLLVSLIPYVGAIILFIFMVLDSQPGPNRYGPNPKTGGAGTQGWNQVL